MSPGPSGPSGPSGPGGGHPFLGPALVEEATRKSGLIWVRGQGPERALWHVWHDGAAYVVGDGAGEQPLPGLTSGETAEITVRSKDKGGRLVAWTASVDELEPRSAAWEAVVPELKGKRLNAVAAEEMPERWARDCRVLRLAPLTSTTELPDGSLAAPPLPSAATTRRPVPAALPRLLFSRRSGRAKRSRDTA
ncbi:hypothetical protein I3J09_08775 [Streptomyces clavuligerus]|nr:hypothetical protein [Streptomyces clavuligerus]ANW21857.1 hypothetical protein BB341_08670 [Streptomyces clavuligerus]AXU12856.1 hypothetical protein D1794_08990 [Streptomyces clavuligerus]EDY48439.1 conserved hypothetical protein [Streptomyces clavuligerus]MBY6302772.1 hypothetical protein [Streptomyces clavuligerus]QCS09247.1 hypothetical protein CRV15_08420 [Streptomyces clavuligerus]